VDLSTQWVEKFNTLHVCVNIATSFHFKAHKNYCVGFMYEGNEEVGQFFGTVHLLKPVDANWLYWVKSILFIWF